jgi:hypothetical protein
MRWHHPEGMPKTTQRALGARGTYTIAKGGGRMWKLTRSSPGDFPVRIGPSSDSVRDLKKLVEVSEGADLSLPPGTTRG